MVVSQATMEERARVAVPVARLAGQWAALQVATGATRAQAIQQAQEATQAARVVAPARTPRRRQKTAGGATWAR